MTVPVKVRPTSLYFYRRAILQAVPFAFYQSRKGSPLLLRLENADHNADDDTNSLVDIELGFGIGNGGLRLAVDLVALVVDGFPRTLEEVFDFVEHGFLPFRF